ncbi:MAG: NmrA family NAD(P)-binding protein [Cyanobacteria bacterium SZAS TMP-1]|nr:NmrA family NAD(P)-binding protein [Cyanobacteria bacterium SZAS TMP-1]
MIKPKVLVTGATGQTGAALVAELRRHDWPVRALVSREDHRSAQLRSLGAEIVVADMYDPEQLYLAARGTQRAYYLPLMRPYMIQAACAFMVAARDARVEYIVQMSQWTSSAAHPTAMTRQTWLVDNVFSMIPGVAHTIFNPGMFAHNFLRMIDFAALLGVFPVLMGDSKSAPISNEDMARAAAALLMGDPSEHAGKSYRPTGPELLSGADMARVIAKVVNHAVVPVKLPLWMFRKVARMQKVDPYSISLLLQYIEDSKRGAFEFEGGVTQVMEELTGSPAENFEVTARRYAARPFAQQTFENRIKAFIDFNITPFYPAYDIEGYERKLELPVPSKALYCMQDDRWRRAHSEQMSEQGFSHRLLTSA